MTEKKTRTLITRPRGLSREEHIEWEALLAYQPPQDDGTPATWTKGIGRTALLAELARMYSEATGQKRKEILETWQLIRELTRNVVPFRRREPPPPRHPDAPPTQRIPLIKRVYGDEHGGAFLGASFALQLFDVDREHMREMAEAAKTQDTTISPTEISKVWAKRYREQTKRTKHGHPEERVARLVWEITRHHTQKALARMLGLESEFLEYVKAYPVQTWKIERAVPEGNGTYTTATRIPGHLADNTYQRGEIVVGQLSLFGNYTQYDDEQIEGIRRSGAELTPVAEKLMHHLTRQFTGMMHQQAGTLVGNAELITGPRELVRALEMRENGSSLERVDRAVGELCKEVRAWVWKERAEPKRGKKNNANRTTTHRTFGTIFVLEEVWHDLPDGSQGRLKHWRIKPSEIFLAQAAKYYMSIPEEKIWRPAVEDTLGEKLTDHQGRFFGRLFFHFAKARTDISKHYKMFHERRLEICESWQDIAGGMQISEDVVNRKKSEALAQIRTALELAQRVGYVTEYAIPEGGDVRYVIDLDKMYAIMPELAEKPPRKPGDPQKKKRKRKTTDTPADGKK